MSGRIRHRQPTIGARDYFADFAFCAFTFAHLAFCAALMLAFPAALIFRFFFGAADAAAAAGAAPDLAFNFDKRA